MGISYPAEAANIMVCDHFATTARHVDLESGGKGTPTLTQENGASGRGGVAQVGTAAVADDSHWMAWGYPHQPSLRRGTSGPIVACQGGATMFSRLGFPALGTRLWFFGWIEEPDNAKAIGDDDGVGTFIAQTSDELTYQGSRDLAGFLLHSGLTDPTRMRVVSSHKSLTRANEAPVKTDYTVEVATNPNDGEPDHMPGFSIDLDEDGEIHCFINGARITDVKGALDPLKAYRAAIIFETTSAVVKHYWIDSFGFGSRVLGGLPPL